jgi:hypothetical protein
MELLKQIIRQKQEKKNCEKEAQVVRGKQESNGMDNLLDEKNNTLDTINNTLEEKNIDLEEKNNTLEGKNNTLEGKNNTLERKNNTLERKNNTLERKNNTLEEKNNTLEDKNNTLDEPELVFRLRKLKQPVKLFGESFQERLERLMKAEEDFIQRKRNKPEAEVNISALEEIFPADVGLYEDSSFFRQARECQSFESQGKVWKKEKWRHPFIEEAEELDQVSKSLIISLYWRTVLEKWTENFRDEERKLYSSTLLIFKKLIHVLKMQDLQDQVLNMLFICVRHCQLHSYQKAYDVHLQLSSLTSFHKNEHKSGAMNSDLGFRKIAQTFKRIITLSERLFPSHC